MKEKKGPRLYFDVALGAGVTSIKGMSGGPVFALQHVANGKLRYWLVGVQSSWLPDKRIVAVCPAPLLGHTLLLTMHVPAEILEQLLALESKGGSCASDSIASLPLPSRKYPNDRRLGWQRERDQ